MVARLLGVGIAQAFGRGSKPVNGDAGNVSTECSSFKAKGTPYYRESLRIDLMVVLAGMLAQQIYRPQYTKGLGDMEGWESDKRYAISFATKYCLGSVDGTIDLPPDTPIPREAVETLCKSIMVEVEKMLRENWAKVERVAGSPEVWQ